MDRTFTIYTGKSRRATKWARRDLTWPELKEALTTFKVTDETLDEYLTMPRERQQEVKDVGGFVGGTLEGGVRKKANLRARSMITLDYDGFTPAQLDTLRDVFGGVSWVAYSTHKHSPREWRVRIVIPLSRDVDPDEYVAVGRRVAKMIGMAGVDRTTFEPCRLMFWPSRPKDADHIGEAHDGLSLMDPDRILDMYDDWRDPAQWPRTEEEADIFSTSAVPTSDPRTLEIWRQYTSAATGNGDGSTLEDPEKKTGVVGAFCRTYGISAAISAFLSDVYAPYSQGRYTYTAGKSVGGAVVYADRWLFSHHATDPAGGRALNSWDLVRLHKFGYLDDGSRAKKTAQLPSQRAMTELAMKDKGTARLVAEETAEAGRRAFDGIELGDDAPDWDEMEQGMRDRKGKFRGTRGNIAKVLLHHPAFKGKIRYNVFSGKMEVEPGGMPWPRSVERKLSDADDRSGAVPPGRAAREWTDEDSAALRAWMEAAYDVNSKERLDDALETVKAPTAFHPVVEYLDSLVWDGTPRLATLLNVTLGADRTPLNDYLSQLVFVAACGRVRHPGVKYDICPVLYGSEGKGKSTLIALMGGDWTLDSPMNVDSKDAFMLMRGAWLIEMAEMASLKRADVDSVKSFISRTCDDYRRAFGKQTEKVRRSCVFFATTNSELCLRGDGDNRRFPVVTCREEAITEPSWDYIPKWRDQLWAEADHLFRTGFKLYLPPELDDEARRIGKAHNFDLNNPLFDQVETYLERPIPITWDVMDRASRLAFIKGQSAEHYPAATLVPRMQVSCVEILTEGLDCRLDGPNYRSTAREVSAYMNKMQAGRWRKIGTIRDKVYGQQKGWRRVDDCQQEEEDDLI